MKKKIIKHHTYDSNEDSERQYQQKLKVDQRLFQTFSNSFFQCFGFQAYPNDDTAFSHKDLVGNPPKDSKNKKRLKEKKST